MTTVDLNLATEPRRRELRQVDVVDRACLWGSVLAGLSFTWVVYSRLLPAEGLLGFIVCWWLSFTAFYGLVTGLRRGRVVLSDRLASVVAHSVAGLVGFALASVVGYTLIRGVAALKHTTPTLAGRGAGDLAHRQSAVVAGQQPPLRVLFPGANEFQPARNAVTVDTPATVGRKMRQLWERRHASRMRVRSAVAAANKSRSALGPDGREADRQHHIKGSATLQSGEIGVDVDLAVRPPLRGEFAR